MRIRQEKWIFTDFNNEPATPATPQLQRNDKISLLNSFIESEKATPKAKCNTIKNTEPMIASTHMNDDNYREEIN